MHRLLYTSDFLSVQHLLQITLNFARRTPYAIMPFLVAFQSYSLPVAESDTTSDQHTSIRAFLHVGYGVLFPVGNLLQQQGRGGTPYGGFGLTFHSWAITAQFTYFFSERVYVDPLAPFRNQAGAILNKDGLPAFIRTERRGWWLSLMLAYRHQLARKTNLYLWLSTSLGWTQFRLHFQYQGEVPWLNNPTMLKYIGGAYRGPLFTTEIALWHEDPRKWLTLALFVRTVVFLVRLHYVDETLSLWPSPLQGTAIQIGIHWFLPFWQGGSGGEEIYWE